MKKRPRVRIRFKYNTDTGEIEEFIIDDNAPAASEGYHNGVARAIASRLGSQPEIEDAGAISLSETLTPQTTPENEKNKEKRNEKQENQNMAE